MAQLVKNLPTMQETWVQSLDWEDPLEKGTATQSYILLLLLSRFSRVRLFATLWTVQCMELSRPEYWSG